MHSDPFSPTLNTISLETPVSTLSYSKISSHAAERSAALAKSLQTLGVTLLLASFLLEPAMKNALHKRGIDFVQCCEEDELSLLSRAAGIDFIDSFGGSFETSNVVGRFQRLREVVVGGSNEKFTVLQKVQRSVSAAAANTVCGGFDSRQIILRGFSKGRLEQMKSATVRALKFAGSWSDEEFVAGDGVPEAGLALALEGLLSGLRGQGDGSQEGVVGSAVELCKSANNKIPLLAQIACLEALISGFESVPRNLWGAREFLARKTELRREAGKSSVLQPRSFTFQLFYDFVAFAAQMLRVSDVIRVTSPNRGVGCSGKLVRSKYRNQGIRGELRGDEDDDSEDEDLK